MLKSIFFPVASLQLHLIPVGHPATQCDPSDTQVLKPHRTDFFDSSSIGKTSSRAVSGQYRNSYFVYYVSPCWDLPQDPDLLEPSADARASTHATHARASSLEPTMDFSCHNQLGSHSDGTVQGKGRTCRSWGRGKFQQ